MSKYDWLLYVALAGLAWGTYVPIIFYGGSELGGKPSSRLMAILCVGGAYFVIGVLFPLIMFVTNLAGIKWGDVNFTTTGIVFSSLAGVAGAVGAICVIFATQAAVGAGKELSPPNPNAFRVFIAPLIFGLAPVINVLVSVIWHPEKGALTFGIEKLPHPLLWIGIVLVAVGAGLVLYSKEISEPSGPKPNATVPIETKPATPEQHAEPKP
jgi:hypothetical protein